MLILTLVYFTPLYFIIDTNTKLDQNKIFITPHVANCRVANCRVANCLCCNSSVAKCRVAKCRVANCRTPL